MLRSFEYKKRKGDYYLLPNGHSLFNMNGDKDPKITIIIPVITETMNFIKDRTNPFNRFVRGRFWISRKGTRTFTPDPYNAGPDTIGLITYPVDERPKEMDNCFTLNKWSNTRYTHEWYLLKGGGTYVTGADGKIR